MNRNKLEKLRRRIQDLRRSSAKSESFQGLARQLGRKKVKRGKEPTWMNMEFPELRPLSIPKHGARDIPYGTAQSILNQLEDDVLAWEERLIQQSSQKSGVRDE